MATPPAFANIQLRYSASGEMCYNNFFYQSDASYPTGRASDLADAFVSDIISPLQNVLNENVMILSAEVSVGHNPPLLFPEIATRSINLPGLVTGDMLPPFVTATLYKVPDNSTLDPSSGEPFQRAGRIPLSGISESFQLNGNITGVALTALTALAAALEEFTVTIAATDYDFFLSMIKRDTPATPYTTAAYIDSVQVGRIGTQNTRKS